MQTQIFVALLVAAVNAEENWVWSSKAQRSSNDVDVEQSENNKSVVFASYQREREPTTKRPGLSNQQNEDIDRYGESENANVGSRQYYQANAFNSGQLAGFSNFPNNGPLYPTLGNEANGVLVGPGGPTGLIGRSQIPYSLLNGGYPQGLGNGFNGIGQNVPGGYPDQNQFLHGGFTGGFGNPQGNNGFGSVPVNPFPNVQYPNNPQFPQGSQFGTSIPYPGQYAPFQYPPGPGGQYALPNPNNGYPAVPVGSPYGAYGTAFDDNENTNRKFKAEGKSLAVEGNYVDRGFDDKVNTSLKRV